MKLKIEEWIDQNTFSNSTKILFKESFICYKSGANRASLLLSYLGFMTILKERIINSNRPNLFPEHKWTPLIQGLQNEAKWEASVFDATQKQAKIDNITKELKEDPVFKINDNLRVQIKYWKDRRNDCAHFKDNIIDSYHVESFWAFIESNLSKISIEGGLQSLLNQIYRHFDPTYTPPNEDVTELVKKIESSVEATKLDEFWNLLINNSEWNYDLSKSKIELINRSFEVNSDLVNESIIGLLKKEKSYLMDFLAINPDKILRFNFNKQEIRNFWKTQFRQSHNVLEIYTTLLRNSLIPKKEIKEANKIVVNLIKGYSTNPLDHQILIANNFLDAFKSEILDNNSFIGFKSFHWVNDRADLISEIIKNYPADKDILLKLIEHYNLDYKSEWLLKKLDSILLVDNQLTLEYKKIIQKENITVENELKKYFA